MSLQTTTATGDQTIALDAGTTVLRCLNAALLTILGFSGSFTDGDRLLVVADGDLIALRDAQAVSCPLANIVHSNDTVLVGHAGSAEYQYDATHGSWRLLWHARVSIERESAWR